MQRHRTRSLRTLTLALLCAIFALCPGLQGALQADRTRSQKIIYYLYATDGYATLDDGSRPHIYGFIGGRAGEPLTYLDDKGVARTLDEGPPAPSAGPVTDAEAALAGHAQLLAPLIWAGSEDVVEVRLKNLGGGASGSPTSPLGIEFRGLDVAAQGQNASDTPTLAIPANAQLPEAGSVLSYTFRVSLPGTYAYGWDFVHHLGYDISSGMQMSSSAQAMPMNCPCHMLAMPMGMIAQTMQMAAPSGFARPGSADRIYSALDGALVVYDPTDAATRYGPGMGAGGAILGLRYDEDYVVLLTGAQDGAGNMTGMAGMLDMPIVPESHGLLVSGFLPTRFPAETGTRQVQPNYHPFVVRPDQRSHRVLVRILNLSGQPQPVAAITQGFRPAAYQARQLALAAPAIARASWAEGSVPALDPGYPTIQPGESVDVILNLDAPRSVGPDQLAGLKLATTSRGTAGAASLLLSGTSMAGGMAMSVPITGTMTGNMMGNMMGNTMQCPMIAGIAMSVPMTGTMAGNTMQCPMMGGITPSTATAGLLPAAAAR